MRNRQLYCTVLAVILISSSISTKPTWAAGAEQEEMTSGTQTTSSSELDEKMKTKVTVDFQAAPMIEVLNALREQGGINMIIAPEVTGEVTANFKDVPLAEALENILAVHGFGYVTTASIVRILPQEDIILQRPKTNKLYNIAYANVDDVKTAVDGMLTKENGQVAMDKTSNTLMVSDELDRMKLIDNYITRVDKEEPQILVEARVYDVSCEDDLDLGFQWFAGTNTTYSSSNLAAGGQLDPFGFAQFGSNFTQASTGTGDIRFGVLKNDLDLDITLQAVRDKVKARLLASPSIMVLNNKEASIKIVKEIPYQELTQTAAGGNIGTTKFKEVGVELLVTPRVTRDSKIRVDVNPVFSVQTGNVTVVVPGSSIQTQQPIVDKREAHTQALIASGQTVVIGGLRKNETVDQKSKIPVLGDVPIFGAFFRFNAQQEVNSELVVFITPIIVTGENARMSADQQADYDETEQAMVRPEEPNLINADNADDFWDSFWGRPEQESMDNDD